MTTESIQTEQAAPQPAEVKRNLSDKLPVISALSALAAALLSGFVSIWVTSIQSDVNELVASRQDTVERAKLFRSLIQDLNSEDKAGYALLTLWKIYQQEGDRQVVVLAALESQSESAIKTLTRLGFQEELEKYAGSTLQNMAVSGKGEASVAASKIILKTFSPQQTTRYLLDKINSYGASGPDDENVIRLIELATYNKDVREIISDTVDDAENINPYITYVQYKTNEKKPFRQYLDEVKTQPALYAEYIEVVSKFSEDEFTNEDWMRVTDVAIDILKNDKVILEPFITIGAFDVLGKEKLINDKNNSKVKQRIVDVSRDYILRPSVNDVERFTALDALTTWSPVEAVKSISQFHICGNKLGALITVSVEDLLDIPEVKATNPPRTDAGREQWEQWLKQVDKVDAINCNEKDKGPIA